MRSVALVGETTSERKENSKPAEIGERVRPLWTQAIPQFSEKHFTVKNLLLLYHESIEEGMRAYAIFGKNDYKNLLFSRSAETFEQWVTCALPAKYISRHKQ
jgi:hypothetical protein